MYSVLQIVTSNLFSVVVKSLPPKNKQWFGRYFGGLYLYMVLKSLFSGLFLSTISSKLLGFIGVKDCLFQSTSYAQGI